jgi:predicted TIM-barrel fold metal-dependent hydrolase
VPVVDEIGAVDHHAHAVLRRVPTLDEFRGLFSESQHPAQWPHVATGLTYRGAIAELAAFLEVEPTEAAVYEHRAGLDPAVYAATLVGATGTDVLMLDDGFPPPDESFSLEEMAAFAGARGLPVMRIERVGEEALAEGSLAAVRELVRATVSAARSAGAAGLKTIAAYRTGLDVREPDTVDAEAALRASGARLDRKPLLDRLLLDALEANEATGKPLPVQVHCGFGDSDLFLPLADPTQLKPVIERFDGTAFVLLHCYPFVRQAGWLAHVYPNVFLDVSLSIPHVWRTTEVVREALELAPASKLLYASDAARTPELYYLASRRFRRALAEVVAEALGAGAVEELARRVLAQNAVRLYDL